MREQTTSERIGVLLRVDNEGCHAQALEELGVYKHKGNLSQINVSTGIPYGTLRAWYDKIQCFKEAVDKARETDIGQPSPQPSFRPL